MEWKHKLDECCADELDEMIMNYSTFPAQITKHCLNKYWLGCYPVVNFTFQYFCDIG